MRPVTGRKAPLQHARNPRGTSPVAARAVALAATFAVVCALGSCSLMFPPPAPPPEEVSAPQAVRETALAEAARYIGVMEYEWGGQDVAPRGIDCSGLVVNVYHYAATVHGFGLPFADSTAADLEARYSVPVQSPAPGDLIFMGEPPDPDLAPADARPVTHVAIYESEAAGMITFIDSTLKEDQGIDGVSRRSYPVGDSRFISFGRLLVLQ